MSPREWKLVLGAIFAIRMASFFKDRPVWFMPGLYGEKDTYITPFSEPVEVSDSAD
jgi:hypothetical protein